MLTWVSGGPRAMGQPNQEGRLVKELIDRCLLHVLSQSGRSEGQNYTFWNSDSETTVENILGDYRASCLMIHCCTHECAPLNTCDHLQITASLRLDALPHSTHTITIHEKVNWTVTKESPCLSVFQSNVSAGINPLLGKGYDNADDLNREISEVVQFVSDTSLRTLPLLKPHKKRKTWYKDTILAALGREKKAG